MKIEDIMKMWTKDSSIDETELATESSNIPVPPMDLLVLL